MTSDTSESPMNDANLQPAVALTNSELLRSHLTPGSLAIVLMDAWKKDDPGSQARMLTALNDFHKSK